MESRPTKFLRLAPLALTGLCALALAGCCCPRPVATTGEPRKLLFIGDSFTFCNDGVGHHVKLLAAADKVPKTIVAEIVRAHRELSAALRIPVPPVGLAFERAGAKRPALPMLGPDKEHESIHGTYLAANVIYATVFRESPVGSTYRPAGVSAEQALFLQRLAWETVRAWQRHPTAKQLSACLVPLAAPGEPGMPSIPWMRTPKAARS